MPKIHPTALVSEDATVAHDVEIGPFTVVESGVTLESGVRLGGHVWIGNTDVGEGSSIGWGSVIGADPQDLSFDQSVDSKVLIGPHNTLREYVTIHRGSKRGTATTIGTQNFLMTGVHLAHDVQMGDHNVLANNVMLGGHVHIGKKTFLGGGSGLHQFIHVGDYSICQGNAAISQDIPPYCIAHGQNYLAGLNTVGLRRAGFTSEDRAEIKSAYHLLFQQGLSRREALALANIRTWSHAAQVLFQAVANPSRKGIIST